MISINTAIEKVINFSKPLQSLKLKLAESVSFILAEDITSPINMPPFRQSAMDGYALHLHDTNNYAIIDEVKAGDNKNPILKSGEAIRIFTGAPIPDSANAVVIQEKVTHTDNILSIENNHTVSINDNIRPLGEQIHKGGIALKKGTKLTPGAIGFLASLGITEVTVFKKPNISIVVTGNELAEVGQKLEYGQIYESNSIMLLSALHNFGYTNISIHKVSDNFNDTCNTLKNVIEANDVVLITGGISVGDYDFVSRSLEYLNITEIFYKVKQKPGKPLYFGKKEDTLIFALPGNPAAALSCFYIYVNMALKIISGEPDYKTTRKLIKSTNDFIKKGDRPQFLKAIEKNNEVTILEGQSSAMLQTFALANALVFVPENIDCINKGDFVEVIKINHEL